MKIEHEALGWCMIIHEDTVKRVWVPDDVPHQCTVPNCPGDLNRRKLEMFSEMLGHMVNVQNILGSHLSHSFWKELCETIEKAKSLK